MLLAWSCPRVCSALHTPQPGHPGSGWGLQGPAVLSVGHDLVRRRLWLNLQLLLLAGHSEASSHDVAHLLIAEVPLISEQRGARRVFPARRRHICGRRRTRPRGAEGAQRGGRFLGRPERVPSAALSVVTSDSSRRRRHHHRLSDRVPRMSPCWLRLDQSSAGTSSKAD